MKKIIAGVLMASFLIASTGVQAQRGSRGGGGGRSSGGGGERSFNGGGGGNAQPSRSFGSGNSGRSFDQQPSRSFNQPQRNIAQSQPQRSLDQPQRSINTQRDVTTQQRSFSQQRNFPQSGGFNSRPNNIANNRSFGSNRTNVVVQNNYYGNRGYGGYYAPHYRSIGTYHYYSSPRLVISIGGPYRTIPWLGIPYNYYNGYWYRPYGASFQLIAPPFGIRIGTLPFGYSPIYGPWGDYYYYNNVFYRHPVNDNSNYEVIDAPLGAQVPELPKGATVRVINTQKYYELDGVFYQEDLKDGQIWYTVVGKNGVLSTQEDTTVTTPNTTPQADNLGTGGRISVLPEGSKSITINGQQLYVSPGGNYYQQVIDGTNTWYEVVGQ